MKLAAICVLALIAYAHTAPSCQATDYCMGCHASTANTCTACFNWGSGSVGARALNNNNCQTAMPTALKVTDCKYYAGNTVSTATTMGSVWHCAECKKDFKNYTESSTTVACSGTALTLSGATCTKISNCLNTVCNDDTTTDTTGCGLCKKNYAPATFIDTTVGGTTCSSTMSITNCEMAAFYSSTMTCVSCKSKYAVKNDGSSCVSYTTDSNCRVLQSDDTNCSLCWNAYYWNATVCKLFAKVVVAGFMSVLAMIMF